MKCSFLVLLLLAAGLVYADDYKPAPLPEAVVISGDARFTVLTPRVIRMEWSDGARFEDRASLVFVNRNLPVPDFKQKVEGGWLQIETESITLKYEAGSGKFGEENLRIEFKVDAETKEWRPGMENSGNLKGTAKTLDRYDGDTEFRSGEKINLGEGIISRDGWAVVDDTGRPLFDGSEWSWVQPRPDGDHQDLYFFGYGFDYKAALKDFTSIAGNIALPPKYVFGSWWSRYWEYTDWEMRELVEEFETHDVPIDVFVVDMDWHITSLPEWYDEDGKKIRDQATEGAGWTGFTWNKNYFPDPDDFLEWTEEKNLTVCMNLHPASGIQPHESQYPAMAKAMGIDPESNRYVPFDIVNKDFAKNFMEIVMRPMERSGVDFWWLDWQQWSTTSIEGVNPVFYLNYVFFSDMERRNEKRPMIFHRYGGLGNHRYQIGFSGDALISWKSLDFQPYFTATASNVGFGFWSHDIGGHMYGESFPELYTRWVQFGTFSPILRTHCTKDPKGGGIERRIWAYPVDNFYAMRDAFHLRYALIPYIYTAAREAHDTGISMCRPMYYDYPRIDEAYQFDNQYMFGNDLLVAPVTSPMAGESLFVMKDVWLPEGEWYEWSSGALVEGGGVISRSYPLDEIPLFVKAGGVIPMQPAMRHVGEKPVDPLILNIFPGESGSARIYEDEGNTNDYKEGSFSFTPVRFEREDSAMRVVVGPVEGGFPGMLEERKCELRLVLTHPPESVSIGGEPAWYDADGRGPGSWDYDGEEMTTIIRTPKLDVHQETVIRISFRNTDTAVLSGKKGALRRVRTFMKFLATKSWDRSVYSNDTVVRAAQAGYRIGRDPGSAEREIRKFDEDWDDITGMLGKVSYERPEYQPYLDLLRAGRE